MSGTVVQYVCVPDLPLYNSNYSTTAVQQLYYTTYYYTAAVFAVCTYIARPRSFARRRSPAAAFVGYTLLYTAAVPGTIDTVPYLVAVCIYTTFYSPLHVYMIYRYRYVLPFFRPPSLSRCRSSWLYTAVHSSTYFARVC